MHSGDAGSVLSGLLWEMKQALGPAMASGRLYEDEALLQMPLRAFPGLCMASRQSGLLQAAGLGEAVNYAEHPERTAAIGAAMQGGKLDGWAEMEDTLLSGVPAVCASFRAGRNRTCNHSRTADDDSDTLKKACEVSCGRDGQ